MIIILNKFNFKKKKKKKKKKRNMRDDNGFGEHWLER